jgi:peptide/nickel transport system substrate-binding protein
MSRRHALLLAMAAVGVTLLLAAAFVGHASSGMNADSPKNGRTMRLNLSGTDVDFTDPSLAFTTSSWQIEYATALELYNYPDGPAPLGSQLQPEAATGFPRVTNDGKTYTIQIRSGLRLSNGATVTAANFAEAINRTLSKAMQAEPAWIAPDIVGAAAVRAGTSSKVSGVVARGNTLIIKLREPDGALPAKLATPPFQALPLNIATDPHGVSVYPSGGPYHIVSRTIGRRIVLKRNKYYGGDRPAYVDTFIISTNTDFDQSLHQVERGQVAYDMGGLPPSAPAELGKLYGVNRGQFWVTPLVETDYVALNTSRPPFSQLALRKAANYAIDRPAMLLQRGAYAGTVTDQILPPGMPGFRRYTPYPLTGPDFAKARALAGNKCGTIRLDTATTPTGTAVALAQVVEYDLSQMGCTVNVKIFDSPSQLYAVDGTRGEPFDAALVGWNHVYADPGFFIDWLLNGDNIQAAGNNNIAYLNVPKLNRQIGVANRMLGTARDRAYGALDVLITGKYAPWVAYDNRNQREFISARTGGYLFQPALAFADLDTFYVK